MHGKLQPEWQEPVWWSEEPPLEGDDDFPYALVDGFEFRHGDVLSGAFERYGHGEIGIYVQLDLGREIVGREPDLAQGFSVDASDRPDCGSTVEVVDLPFLEQPGLPLRLGEGSLFLDCDAIGQNVTPAAAAHHCGWYEQPVFVSVGDPVEDREGVVGTVDSVWRLVGGEFPGGVRTDEPEHLRASCVPKLRFGKDRKLDFLGLFFCRGSLETFRSELPCDEVQGCADVMDEIAEDKRDDRRRHPKLVHAVLLVDDVAPFVRVVLHEQAITVWTAREFDLYGLEVVEVRACAVELEPSRRETTCEVGSVRWGFHAR